MKVPALVATVVLLAVAVPPSSFGAVASALEEPDTTFASNTVIDIIQHGGGIWLATGEGVNFTFDDGLTWLLYDADNGLNSEDISALFSQDGRLWLAGAYSDVIGGEIISYSDTLMYTDNDGRDWFTVDFTTGGPSPVANAFGAQKTVYDLAGSHAQGDSWVFSSGWAGGFLASRDNGDTWRRVFPSRSDSITFDLFYNDPNFPGTLPNRLLYFSAAADTTHGDSMFAWAGSAGGVTQFVFAPRELKPGSKHIIDIVFCDSCDTSDSLRVFLGGANGVTRGSSTGQPFRSSFVDDGLPGPFITAQFAAGGKLFVGTAASADGPSTGLAFSVDGGLTFTGIDSTIVPTGADQIISDIGMFQDRLYVAAQEAGLLVSADTGLTWQEVIVDPADTSLANRRNVVWALDPLADTLRLGTDSGLVTLYMDPAGVLDSSRYDVFTETGGNRGLRVIDVRTQLFMDTATATLDSLAVWTINRPLTSEGIPTVLRGSEVVVDLGGGDTVIQWSYVPFQWNVNTHDIDFLGDSVFVVGDAGVRYSDDGLVFDVISIRDTTSSDRLDNDTTTAIEVLADTVFIGTTQGFAVSTNRGQSYKIFRVNTDSLTADVVINHTRLSSFAQIRGDWIPAMGLQHVSDDPYGRLWISSRPTEPGAGTGISMGQFKVVDTATGRKGMFWQVMFDTLFAWNFAFNGDSVFAATDDGLMFTADDTSAVWDTIPLVDAQGNQLADPDASVYAVEVVGNDLWVGTGGGALVMDLETLVGSRSVYYVDSTTPPGDVYAFPVPFRNSSGGDIKFHFQVEEPADVTLEVYDAAMNLVARVLDNEPFAPGIYPDINTRLVSWDGRNGRGDQVAVGMYYFKIELSTGDVRWGKLAVIP